MAWSDAARAAALEIRRHKAGRTIMVGPGVFRSRDQMAKNLRRARKTTGHAGLNTVRQRNSVARATAGEYAVREEKAREQQRRGWRIEERRRKTFGGMLPYTRKGGR